MKEYKLKLIKVNTREHTSTPPIQQSFSQSEFSTFESLASEQPGGLNVVNSRLDCAKVCGPDNSPSFVSDLNVTHDSGIKKPAELGRIEHALAGEDGTSTAGLSLLDYSLIKAEKKVAYYNNKRIVSGDIIEDYEYSRPQSTKKHGNPEGRKVTTCDDVSRMKSLIKSGNIAKREIRRLVNTNIGKHGKERAKFLTITFGDNVQDIKAANHEFKNFLLRLNYHVYKRACNDLQYLCVIQFQARGAIHWHVIFFNLPYIPVRKLADIWGQGFVKINAIDDVDNVGAYVAAYVGNERDGEHNGNGGRFVDIRYFNQKRYFKSKGLLHSDVFTCKESLPYVPVAPIYEVTFENEYTGKVFYRQYNLNKKPLKARFQVNRK